MVRHYDTQRAECAVSAVVQAELLTSLWNQPEPGRLLQRVDSTI